MGTDRYALKALRRKVRAAVPPGSILRHWWLEVGAADVALLVAFDERMGVGPRSHVRVVLAAYGPARAAAIEAAARWVLRDCDDRGETREKGARDMYPEWEALRAALAEPPEGRAAGALQVTAAFDQHGEYIAMVLHRADREGKAQALRELRARGYRRFAYETMDASEWLAGDVCELVDFGRGQ